MITRIFLVSKKISIYEQMNKGIQSGENVD